MRPIATGNRNSTDRANSVITKCFRCRKAYAFFHELRRHVCYDYAGLNALADDFREVVVKFFSDGFAEMEGE